MKTRSLALFNYLSDSGVLNGTPEQVAAAKHRYRRDYKKQWKLQNRSGKEIRIECTIQLFESIKLKAEKYKMTHTAYARNVILAAIESTQLIADKDCLLKILQLIGMAVTAMAKNNMPLRQITEMLEQAERMLLDYVKKQS